MTYWRGALKLVGAMAIVYVMAPAVTSLFAQEDPQRIFVRCIQTCNEVRAACHDACVPTCTAMFPNSNPQRNACIATCRAQCDVQSDDCKAQCKEDRDNGCPTEP